MSSARYTIAPVVEGDLEQLLGLMRAYCDFYASNPPDAALLALARALIADPLLEGVQLLARDGQRRAAGFATVFWSWDTTEASRIGIMHDLFVTPAARGRGLADALIAACVRCCAERGASRLDWQTGPENLRAQAVYERVGGRREAWIPYAKQVPSSG